VVAHEAANSARWIVTSRGDRDTAEELTLLGRRVLAGVGASAGSGDKDQGTRIS